MEITEAVKKQLAEEIGDDELSKENLLILNQKFGLSPVVLTQSEKNLINKYER